MKQNYHGIVIKFIGYFKSSLFYILMTLLVVMSGMQLIIVSIAVGNIIKEEVNFNEIIIHRV
jgi:hypothetical protein